MLLTETTDNKRKGRKEKANTVLKSVKPCKIEIPNFIKIRTKGPGAHNPRFHSNMPTRTIALWNFLSFVFYSLNFWWDWNDYTCKRCLKKVGKSDKKKLACGVSHAPPCFWRWHLLRAPLNFSYYSGTLLTRGTSQSGNWLPPPGHECLM